MIIVHGTTTAEPVTPHLYSLNPSTNLNSPTTQFPKRWMYPQDELDHNADNVDSAIQSQYGGNDDVNSLM